MACQICAVDDSKRESRHIVGGNVTSKGLDAGTVLAGGAAQSSGASSQSETGIARGAAKVGGECIAAGVVFGGAAR